jgi:hypothetical protein
MEDVPATVRDVMTFRSPIRSGRLRAAFDEAPITASELAGQWS